MILVSALLGLSLIIIIHEFGHFSVARFFNVPVKEAHIGFGFSLFNRSWGETNYSIGIIPIGGRVVLDNEEFLKLLPWKRSCVICAGPLANFLLAFLLCIGAAWYGDSLPTYYFSPPVVNWVSPESAADQAGIGPGDLVTELDGYPIADWKSFREISTGIQQDEVLISIKRNENQFPMLLTLRYPGDIGITEPIPPIIGMVSPGSPASQAGLITGMRINQYGKENIVNWAQFLFAVQQEEGKTVPIVTLDPTGQKYEATVTPEVVDGEKRIGLSVAVDLIRHPQPIFIAVVSGFQQFKRFVLFTAAGIMKLFGESSIDTLGGPVAAVKTTAMALTLDGAMKMKFLAFISLQIGFFNLLPLTVLDGGQLVLLAYEKLRNQQPSERFIKAYHLFGVVGFVLLLMLVFYNDIMRNV